MSKSEAPCDGMYGHKYLRSQTKSEIALEISNFLRYYVNEG